MNQTAPGMTNAQIGSNNALSTGGLQTSNKNLTGSNTNFNALANQSQHTT